MDMDQDQDAGSPQPEAQPEPEATPSFEPSREKFLSFLDKAEGKWDNPQFRKAWSYFEKQLGTALNGNQNTLNRKLYGFGHERKRKNSQEITVGSQHVARRRYKHRGRSAAPAGRRPKPTVDKPVMFPRHDDEDWEDVILRPPPKKKSREQRKRPHDLMAAVSQNKLPGKKH